jgi:hypothetical protein
MRRSHAVSCTAHATHARGCVLCSFHVAQHAGDAALDGGVGLDGATFKHTEVGDDARLRGGSTLGSNAVGTAALTAALTLHPCVHLSGCGDASKDVLHSMLSSVGGCTVALVVDEETGRPTGEASATFGSAAAAEVGVLALKQQLRSS